MSKLRVCYSTVAIGIFLAEYNIDDGKLIALYKLRSTAISTALPTIPALTCRWRQRLTALRLKNSLIEPMFSRERAVRGRINRPKLAHARPLKIADLFTSIRIKTRISLLRNGSNKVSKIAYMVLHTSSKLNSRARKAPASPITLWGDLGLAL